MRHRGIVVVAALALAAVSCSGGTASTGPTAPQTGTESVMTTPETISVSSGAFAQGATIPQRYTCKGAGVSPPLAWSGVPDSAAAVALVVDDPDAPRGTFTHWLVVDIPPTVTSVGAGVVPEDGVQITNSAGRPGYFGPCPPSGTHHYRFTVYALGSETGLDGQSVMADALRAVQSRTIAWGRLVGLVTH